MQPGTPATLRRAAAGLALLLTLAPLSGCDWSAELGVGQDNTPDVSDATPPVADTDVAGLSLAVSDQGFSATLDDLNAAIAASNRYSALAVDHRDNGRAINLELRPTTLLLLDDANRSAPLILADARVALVLPARILVYRDSDDDVGVAYNDADYLAARFDLADAEDGALDGYERDLRALVEDATGNGVTTPKASTGMVEGEGIESVASASGYAATVANLAAAIDADENLLRIATIDEAQRALQVGRAINPGTLFVFEDVAVATRLLQSSQTAGIDLPQKMLVTQNNDGDVTIYYEAPRFVADRHGVDGQSDRIEATAALLSDLAERAASGPDRTSATGTASGATTTTLGTVTSTSGL